MAFVPDSRRLDLLSAVDYRVEYLLPIQPSAPIKYREWFIVTPWWLLIAACIRKNVVDMLESGLGMDEKFKFEGK